MGRRGAAALLALMSSGAALAAPRMLGFDALATRSARIDIAGIPMWMNGDFRLGSAGTLGHVRRTALAASDQPDPAHADGEIVRFGRVRFDVAGPEVGGTLAADCRYDRSETRVQLGRITVAEGSVPLLYACTLMRDGRRTGVLELGAAPPRRGDGLAETRVGRITLGDTELTLRSVHRMPGGRWAVAQPLGYEMAAADGRVVGAVELGTTSARLAVPRDAAGRDAAVAAGLALALFWNPGDSD